MKSTLRAHLDAIVDGSAPRASNAPSDECLEISAAIAACARNSVSNANWGRARGDALPAPSRLLPPLP